VQGDLLSHLRLLGTTMPADRASLLPVRTTQIEMSGDARFDPPLPRCYTVMRCLPGCPWMFANPIVTGDRRCPKSTAQVLDLVRRPAHDHAAKRVPPIGENENHVWRDNAASEIPSCRCGTFMRPPTLECDGRKALSRPRVVKLFQRGPVRAPFNRAGT